MHSKCFSQCGKSLHLSGFNLVHDTARSFTDVRFCYSLEAHEVYFYAEIFMYLIEVYLSTVQGLLGDSGSDGPFGDTGPKGVRGRGGASGSSGSRGASVSCSLSVSDVDVHVHINTAPL